LAPTIPLTPGIQRVPLAVCPARATAGVILSHNNHGHDIPGEVRPTAGTATTGFLTPAYEWFPVQLPEGVRNDNHGNGNGNGSAEC
jgi:hypothetical protein